MKILEKIIDKVYRLLAYIGQDMIEPLGYLLWGLFAGCIFLLLWEIWHKGILHGSRPVVRFRKWILFLSVVYVTVLLIQAFLSREPGSRIEVDLKLFSTWGDSMMDHAYFIENIIMFLPFGFLFPIGFRFLRKVGNCIIAGFFCSVCLELMQLVTGRGYCQLDDVVTNTLGTAIGWVLYRIGVVCISRSSLYTKIETAKNNNK
jgi:glycopeptide antibiotics resistance protein